MLGSGAAFGSKRAQRCQQQLRVVLDGPHAVALKELWEGPLHHAAVGEHVANAGGNAQVVFEDDKLAGVEAEQVGAHDSDVDIARDLEAAHLTPVVLATVDEIAWDDAVGEDFSVGAAESGPCPRRAEPSARCSCSASNTPHSGYL